ncbi:MAG: zinc-dependent metalloprotease, partial [Acidobacteriota bacterium]
TPPELEQWALARLRQLAAHEVGHTLGLAHNYYDSRLGRISVMDYQAPLVTLKPDGSLDYSKVYDVGIGAWDKVAITWGYQDFPNGSDEPRALQQILDDAWSRDLIFLTNQDISATPKADQWSNGTDPAAQLNLEMDVRRAALNRFGENAIRRGMPVAEIEEALVPLYLHHRYQVEASATALGGQDFIYAMRGDGRTPTAPVSAAVQRATLGALDRTLAPAELAVPEGVRTILPPRPQGYDATRELFPRYTGVTFDAITPAVVAARVTVDAVLDGERAARLVEQHALDASLPGLDEVIDSLFAATGGAKAADGYQAEIARATERIVAERVMRLAATAAMPQVRAIAALKLQRKAGELDSRAGRDVASAAAGALLARDIRRFLERPYSPQTEPAVPEVPPGAPIGEPDEPTPAPTPP